MKRLNPCLMSSMIGITNEKSVRQVVSTDDGGL